MRSGVLFLGGVDLRADVVEFEIGVFAGLEELLEFGIPINTECNMICFNKMQLHEYRMN
jgi:hypothetical protein